MTKRYKAAEQETERLREEINKLNPEKRKAYYTELPDILKDQDTYAALNYAFFLSLHHIYVGKYWLFALNLLLILLIFVSPFFFVLWLAFECFQLYELFFSQSIILEENNRRMQSLLEKIKST